jgi:amino acid transporter
MAVMMMTMVMIFFLLFFFSFPLLRKKKKRKEKRERRERRDVFVRSSLVSSLSFFLLEAQSANTSSVARTPWQYPLWSM